MVWGQMSGPSRPGYARKLELSGQREEIEGRTEQNSKRRRPANRLHRFPL